MGALGPSAPDCPDCRRQVPPGWPRPSPAGQRAHRRTPAKLRPSAWPRASRRMLITRRPLPGAATFTCNTVLLPGSNHFLCAGMIKTLGTVRPWPRQAALDASSGAAHAGGGRADRWLSPPDLVLYCEAFLTTYRTFIAPEELIRKLQYRYPFPAPAPHLAPRSFGSGERRGPRGGRGGVLRPAPPCPGSGASGQASSLNLFPRL